MSEPDDRPPPLPSGRAPWTDLPPVPAAALAAPPRLAELAVTRRGFLAALGTGGAASLAACARIPVKEAIPFLSPAGEVTPGVSSRYATTCTACPAACGVLATVRDGRPVKLEGRADHPRSRGGLCAVGQADLRALYDPARLRGPTANGAPIGWTVLDGEVGRGLAAARASGKTVAVLSRTIGSPTARRALQAFLDAAGGGRLVEWEADPESASPILEAYEQLDGVGRVPAIDLERADLVVSIASDFLGAGRDPVADTAAWAARRRAAERVAPRHVQIEGTLTLTGAAADERWPARASERRLVALGLLRAVAAAEPGELARAIAVALGPVPEAVGFVPRIEALSRALAAARGRALVLAGDADLPTQLAAALLNRLLGNEGNTLDLSRPLLARRGRDADVLALAAELRAGAIGALFVVDADPVDELPDGEAIAEAIRKVPLAVAVSNRPTATARACRLVAAAHHGLESWGDHRPRAGVLTLGQPVVRPLFDTRHPWESFLAWRPAGDAAPAAAVGLDWRTHLVTVWGERVLSGTDLAAAWRAAVAAGAPPAGTDFRDDGDGASPATGDADFRDDGARDAAPLAKGGPSAAGVALRDALATARVLPAGGDFEVELTAEVALRDGSRAFVPWLRELPDPITRVSWAACARVAPATASALGLEDGDVIHVETGGHAIELPIRRSPGQHAAVIGLPVGYGRADAIASAGGQAVAVGPNAYRLAPAAGARIARAGLAAIIAPTGARDPLPLLQWASSAEGRPLVHQVSARGDAVPTTHGKPPTSAASPSMWAEHAPLGPRWEMVIDLDACTGCSACIVACQAENNIPVVGPDEIRRHRDMYWLRMDRYFAGPEESPDVLFEPMLCAQCGNAPCETVCPVAATVHSSDGLNQQVYNRCVGTRYCANNCPYKVRRFNWFDHPIADPLERMVLNPDVVVRDRGVMEKCTFCVQRIQAARIAARAAGLPGALEVTTACQESCPARAIRFGDGASAAGEIAALTALPRAFEVLGELGVRPAVTYLAKVRNRAGAASGGSHEEAT